MFKNRKNKHYTYKYYNIPFRVIGYKIDKLLLSNPCEGLEPS